MKNIGFKKLSDNEKHNLFAEMFTLADAGLDFSRMFLILTDERNEKETGRILACMYDKMTKGHSMHEAMQSMCCFSDLDCNVIRIGELTGNLVSVMSFLAEFYLNKDRRRKFIVSVLSYPVMIFCFALAVLIFMMTLIVPMFSQFYNRMDSELPYLTSFLIRMSEDFISWMTSISIVVIGIFMLVRHYRWHPEIIKLKSSISMNTPFIGTFVKSNVQCTFCRFMYLLLSSGISITNALELVSGSIQIQHYKDAITYIIKNLKTGTSLSDAMMQTKNLFDTKVVMMIKVGEESNRLPQMFLKSDEVMSSSLEHKIKMLKGWVEPLMITAVGIIVALILISMYLPMFRMSSIFLG